MKKSKKEGFVMQLLVLILTKTECMPQIVSAMVGAGLGDPTVINCEGALNVIDKSNVEPPPIFGSLRYILGQSRKESKMMFFPVIVGGQLKMIPIPTMESLNVSLPNAVKEEKG